MNYNIKLFTEINKELKENWIKVEKNSYPNFYKSLIWINNYILSFKKKRKNSKLRIFVIYSNEEPICILPFEIVKKFRTKILYWACDAKSDFNAPLQKKEFAFKEKDFKEIWNEILKTMPDVDLINLKKQLNLPRVSNNPFISFLKNSKEGTIQQINLPNKWSDYTNRILKNKFYNDLLRTKRLIKKSGKVEFIIAKNSNEKINLLEYLIKQKQDNLEKKNFKSLDDEDLNFYKNFENYKNDDYFTQVSAIKLNNNFVAMHWGIISKNNYYYLLPSMKSGDVKKLSPGKLLLSLLIRRAISKKLNLFDFGLGEEIYKKKWSNNSIDIFNYLKIRNFKGIFFYILIKINKYIKIYKKL